MARLFNKMTLEERHKIDLFTKIVKKIPYVDRYSYRKKGRFEVIFDGKEIEDMTDSYNQAVFNLLAHVWLIIWADNKAELHVGLTNKSGYRLEIDLLSMTIGHKFEDHRDKLDELLLMVGIINDEPKI